VDIFAQRLDTAGTPQWAANGVAVTADFDQFNPQMAPDGNGGAIIAWEDDRNGFSDIFAQRLDGTGTPLWAFGGVAVSTAAGNQSAPQLIPDGSGGASSGWTTPACRNGRSTAWPSPSPRTKSRGTARSATGFGRVGGAIIVWTDDRNNAATVTDICAQRVTAQGTQ
jgi:hypothetical protein